MMQKYALAILLFSNIIFASKSYAFSSLSGDALKTLHPVIAIGTGSASTSSLSKSASFPIQDPTTDEYYYYSANKATQSSGLFDGFLGMELNVCPQWLVQAGINYHQPAPFSNYGTFVQGVDTESQDTYSFHYGVLLRQVLLEGKLLYVFKELFHPYVSAGLGAAFNKAYNYSTSVPAFLSFTRMYADKSTTSFSYAFGLGMDVDIAPHTRFGVGYRFADLGKVRVGNATIDSTNVSGTFPQSHVYLNEVLVQLSFVV